MIVSAVDRVSRDAAAAAFHLMLRQAQGRDCIGASNQKERRHRLCVRLFFASKLFMEHRIPRSRALFAFSVLCVHTSLSPVAAQQQTREGIITTFAPVVEKVAPSVVTVFTTQTVSRGQTAFSF